MRVVGVGVAIVAVVLCIGALADEWHTVSSAVKDARALPLLGAFLAGFAAMAGLGLLWWRCLAVFGIRVSWREAVAWYLAGELGKYVPGGVWAVLGRGELARRSGKVNRGDAYATTLIGYAAMCFGAALVCGVLAPFLASYGDSFT
ncbi:MAG: hypothetical protein J0H43_00430, partial [Actinobacteria bacterium]|nr:hypothetical protein [Actinomycetota bacterium]